MIIDHIEGWELPDNTKKKYFNELQSLCNLWKGLGLLYNQMEAIERKAVEQIQNGLALETMPEEVKNKFKGKQIKYFSSGNDPLFNWIDKGILYSLFQWYAVSACNYVRLVGYIGKQINPENPKSLDYVKKIIPNVYWFRNKIAAHFARAGNQDIEADRVASVLYQVGFGEDRFRAPMWRVTLQKNGKPSSSTNKYAWSITETHEMLTKRYAVNNRQK